MSTISLCMICKNEAQMLAGCLESARDSVDEIVIIDTGSTDATIEIARECGAKVISAPWVDFSTARNQSLDAASMDWAFVLDADEELAVEGPQVLRELADSGRADAYGLYVINVAEMTEFIDVDETPVFTAIKLFKRQGVSYINPIHERVQLPSGVHATFAPGPLIVHYGYLKDIYTARNKGSRNAGLLRAWREAAPDDPWARFYLARDVLLREGRFMEAAGLFEEVLAELIAAGDTLLGADSFIHLLTCYEEEGSPDAVEDVFRRGIESFPEYIEIRYFYGCFLMKKGDFEQAVEHFGRCLRLNETDPRFQATVRGSSNWRSLLALSDAFSRLGRSEKAIVARTLADRIREEEGSPLGTAENPLLSAPGRRLMGAISEQGLGALDEVADFLVGPDPR